MCGRCLAGFFGTSVLPVGDALTDCCSGSRLPGIQHSSGRAWTFPLGDPCLVSAFVTACSSPEPRAPGAILHFRRLGAAPLRAVLRIRAVRPNLNRRKRATSRWPGAGPTRASVRAGRFAPHTTTSPTRLSPPPLCTGRRSGRPCAAAPRPGAISYPHRLGAVLLRAVLRIRAARSDRRRRATFRWPGAGPTRAAVWAGRCAPTTTTPPARLSPPPPCAGCSSGRPGTVASHPAAISHFHQLGAVPLQAVLRIRTVRPDRRRRATFRWPGAGPTRAAAEPGGAPRIRLLRRRDRHLRRRAPSDRAAGPAQLFTPGGDPCTLASRPLPLAPTVPGPADGPDPARAVHPTGRRADPGRLLPPSWQSAQPSDAFGPAGWALTRILAGTAAALSVDFPAGIPLVQLCL